MASVASKLGMGRIRRGCVPSIEACEQRTMLSGANARGAASRTDPANLSATLTTIEVQQLLSRAAAASQSDDAIIAVVDRGGRVLGVRSEAGVSTAITGDTEKMVFAVDGALSLARTAAFFGNNQSPLTSRLVQFISQTTNTQRVIESDPNIQDPNSTLAGPGFIAPVGIKGHFPPNVPFTPQVDLFAIEYTNRDSTFIAGDDGLRGTADDLILPNRFNVADQNIPANIFTPPTDTSPGIDLRLVPPDSYGVISGLLPSGQNRGIATLPGGIPIFKNGAAVGGIGVFFPGTTGFATAENSMLNDFGYDDRKPDRSIEAEFIGFAAVGGSKAAARQLKLPLSIGTLGGVPALPGFDLPFGRIDLVGVTLDVIGPHGNLGPGNLLRYIKRIGVKAGTGNPNSGTNLPVTTDPGVTVKAGRVVPDGWLVTPHDSKDGSLTAADVETIVSQGIARANMTRSAIRLPINRHTRMVFAVTDKTGEVLGLYRMTDSVVFSFDVAVAKARNVSYYDDPAQLQPQDQVGSTVPVGTAFTARTIRYLALPRFPEGIEGYPPGPFSILEDGGVNTTTGQTIGAALPASAFQSVQGYAAFHPQANFHAQTDPKNQNGVIFFPGSSPLYKDDGHGNKVIVGGLGVSGDGVDQDDDVTFSASLGYRTPATVPRADQVFVRGVRLPYQKFNRNPNVG
ncbi:heme-binding protein [Isosphaeraceae bacterium EP7]